MILISDHSHCHRQGVESWRLPETVGSFSAWTWTTSCRQRRFTFGQSQDDLHKIMMIMIIIKSTPRQILTIMTMAGIFTRWPSWDASSGDWIFSYSSFKARHGECVKQCPITIRSGFEITNVIFSGRNWTELLSPWAGCLYHGKGCKIQIKPGNQTPRWNQIPRQKYQNPHLQFSTWTNPSLTDAKDGGLSNLRIPKFVIILATLVVGGK